MRTWHWLTVAACLVFPLAAGPAIGAACDNWNTKEFFKTATVQKVTNCVQGGVDLNARSENDATPLHWAAGSQRQPRCRGRLAQGWGQFEQLSLVGLAGSERAGRKRPDPAALGGRDQRQPRCHCRLAGDRSRPKGAGQRRRHSTASGSGLEQQPHYRGCASECRGRSGGAGPRRPNPPYIERRATTTPLW